MNEDDGDDHSITKAEGNYDLSVLSWLDRAMTSVLVMTSVSVYLVLKGGNEGWKGKTETLIQSERAWDWERKIISPGLKDKA